MSKESKETGIGYPPYGERDREVKGSGKWSIIEINTNSQKLFENITKIIKSIIHVSSVASELLDTINQFYIKANYD